MFFEACGIRGPYTGVHEHDTSSELPHCFEQQARSQAGRAGGVSERPWHPSTRPDRVPGLPGVGRLRRRCRCSCHRHAQPDHRWVAVPDPWGRDRPLLPELHYGRLVGDACQCEPYAICDGCESSEWYQNEKNYMRSVYEGATRLGSWPNW